MNNSEKFIFNICASITILFGVFVGVLFTLPKHKVKRNFNEDIRKIIKIENFYKEEQQRLDILKTYTLHSDTLHGHPVHFVTTDALDADTRGTAVLTAEDTCHMFVKYNVHPQDMAIVLAHELVHCLYHNKPKTILHIVNGNDSYLDRPHEIQAFALEKQISKIEDIQTLVENFYEEHYQTSLERSLARK